MKKKLQNFEKLYVQAISCFEFKDIQRKCQGCHSQGKNIWKMKFSPGQGIVREFRGWPGKFRKDLESQGKVREFENKWL